MFIINFFNNFKKVLKAFLYTQKLYVYLSVPDVNQFLNLMNLIKYIRNNVFECTIDFYHETLKILFNTRDCKTTRSITQK